MSLRSIYHAALVLMLTTAAATAAETGSNKIQKCQDVTGKWHYGDYAAAECSKSKVDVLSGKGVKTREIAAPPTEAELADRERRKDEIEREKLSTEEKAKRDKILLQTYAVEDDIVLLRDRKLSQVEATIKATEETLKSLRGALGRMEAQKKSEQEKDEKKALISTEKNIAQTNAQIQRHEALVIQKRQEQERLRKQYTEELERYREIKRGQPVKAPDSKPAAR